MADDGDWFAPKAYGYGAGLPIAWQGWALLGGYMAVIFGLPLLLHKRHMIVYVALVLAATVVLVVVSARHTRGGWRWRWGDDR